MKRKMNGQRATLTTFGHLVTWTGHLAPDNVIFWEGLLESLLVVGALRRTARNCQKPSLVERRCLSRFIALSLTAMSTGKQVISQLYFAQ